MDKTLAQELVDNALLMANELAIERSASHEPSIELNQIIAQQGHAMRALIATCTAAIVTALEDR